jgi:hypothetical protein
MIASPMLSILLLERLSDHPSVVKHVSVRAWIELIVQKYSFRVLGGHFEKDSAAHKKRWRLLFLLCPLSL